MTDSIDGPRHPHPDEFEDTLDLVDRCFTRERGNMLATNPHCYDPDRLDRHAIIVENGDVVSHIAGIPDTLVVGPDEIDCLGISGVATDPRHRGNGYMGELLEFWLEQMAEADIALSKLWGDRQRYNSFGWETAGRECAFEITRRSFPEPQIREAYVEHYDSRTAQLELIEDVHANGRYRVKRDRGRHRELLSQRSLETICYTEPGERSYLSFTTSGREMTVKEACGSERGVRGLLGYLLGAYYVDEIRCTVHPTDPLASTLASVSADWELTTQKKLNVRDLPTVLSAFADQMERRWKSTPASQGSDGSLVLGISADSDAARLSWTDGSVRVERVTTTPDIELDRIDLTRFLFAFPDAATGRTDTEPFLEHVLPLDFYVPWVAYV